jgi:ABC-type dipeptide/oligopeptide/nickel transport system ATPase component
MPESEPLLVVEDLKTHFFTRRGVTKAVDGVNFALRAGETLALVGESGSGKSVTCLSLVRLVPEPAGRIVGGRVLLEGEDLLLKSRAEMRRVRGKQIAMVLQDPMTSLNPALTIGTQVAEVLRLHQGLRGSSLRARVLEALSRLRIAAPDTRLGQYPHQFSGGMRQRVSSAIALSCGPRLLIADEPTTSLDVTIQAQYLELLKEVQASAGVAVILVTHDFGIVATNADRVAVMYAGRGSWRWGARCRSSTIRAIPIRGRSCGACRRSRSSTGNWSRSADSPPTCHAWAPGARSRPGARSGNRSATRRTHR